MAVVFPHNQPCLFPKSLHLSGPVHWPSCRLYHLGCLTNGVCQGKSRQKGSIENRGHLPFLLFIWALHFFCLLPGQLCSSVAKYTPGHPSSLSHTLDWWSTVPFFAPLALGTTHFYSVGTSSSLIIPEFFAHVSSSSLGTSSFACNNRSLLLQVCILWS